MSAVVQRAAVSEPPVRQEEILRYAGASSDHAPTVALMHSCLQEMEGRWQYAVCYATVPVCVTGERCAFGDFVLESASLARFLGNASQAVIMAATVGIHLDRLLQKYAHTSPSRAVMLQAIGAERIEALCDAFCAQQAVFGGAASVKRFSPGYGDLPLEAQRTLFAVLDPPKHIGVSLCDSLLMTPTKSVTAVAVTSEDRASCSLHKCRACNKRDCVFRGDI